jgi:prepilin-type N-terminal cleavage/methylation domain-containing protein
MIKKGYTLIELMVVLFIISILAVIATAQYASYVARTQAVEAMLFLERAKGVVIEYHADYGAYPNTNTLRELMPQTSTSNLTETQYLNLMTTNQTGSNQFYEINLRFRSNNISSKLKSKHLTMRYNYNTGSWECVSNNVEKQYLPQVCKRV